MSELRDPPENDDFEWVNDWAHGAAPATGGKPKHEPAQASADASELVEGPAPQETIAVAPAPVVADAPSQEPIPQQPTDTVASKPAVTAQPSFADRIARASRKRGPEADQLVHPVTRRFFAALRSPTSTRQGEARAAADAPAPASGPQPTLAIASASVASTSPELPSEPAPAPVDLRETAPVAATANEPIKVESTDARLAPEASQLERDIADIERARDALLESAPFTVTEPRKARGRFAALRHAESVPILVGSVVGATLLLVFGAAASLISLR